ncbi:hypothetical protein [Rhodospirillaceae bacterium SYSU D60014]|uniref:hypothetical protein n=1 Tax=Virgifigura deserti TaxID=2268457 RepID=UPI000E6705DB
MSADLKVPPLDADSVTLEIPPGPLVSDEALGAITAIPPSVALIEPYIEETMTPEQRANKAKVDAATAGPRAELTTGLQGGLSGLSQDLSNAQPPSLAPGITAAAPQTAIPSIVDTILPFVPAPSF